MSVHIWRLGAIGSDDAVETPKPKRADRGKVAAERIDELVRNFKSYVSIYDERVAIPKARSV